MQVEPLFVATAILVIVTGFYAIQTYWLANVPFRSLLFARLAHKTSGTKSSIEVKIENVEIGAAVAVTCNYLIGSFNGDSLLEGCPERIYYR